MFKTQCLIIIGTILVLDSVDAQKNVTTTLTPAETHAEVSEITSTEIIPEETTEIETTTAEKVTEGASRSTLSEFSMHLVDSLRQSIERRRAERQQRLEERRANALANVQNLSEREREIELQRLERQRTIEEQRLERRREMEARRAGRLPSRQQQTSLDQLREQRLLDHAVGNEAQNEIDGSLLPNLPPIMSDVIRRLVLIEEASGNVRLVDLGTNEGRELISRVTKTVEKEAAELQQEVMRRLKLKLGQL